MATMATSLEGDSPKNASPGDILLVVRKYHRYESYWKAKQLSRTYYLPHLLIDFEWQMTFRLAVLMS